MIHYSTIAIIYNPNSTGHSDEMAHDLYEQLIERIPNTKIKLKQTKHAGHGEAIAYRTSLFTRHALLVSVSGDGGYSDVVNGAMLARKHGRRVTTALVPAGNANDHYHSLHRGDIVERIANGDEQTIDLLKLTGRSHGKSITRYGHSYIGIGLTPQAGIELNKTQLNLLKEIGIIVKVLRHLRSVRVLHDGKIKHYDSLIFSNITRMSKVFELSKKAQPDDGLFEIMSIYKRNKISLISTLLHASLSSMEADAQAREFEFEPLRPMWIQVDGELTYLDAHTPVKVTIAPHSLHCIV